MRNAVKWTSLTLGALILLYHGAWLAWMAHDMEPFGWSPFEWSFLTANPRWLIMPPIGLALLAIGLVLFVRRAD
jgi:hypothetical protein